MKRSRFHHCRRALVRPTKWSLTNTVKVMLFYLTLTFTPVRSYRNKNAIGQQDARQTVCYAHLGCFSRLPPFSPNMPLPLAPRKIQTQFLLRTRQNRDVDQTIRPDAASLNASFFDPSKPTKILIHGFVMLKPVLAKWVPEVTDAILHKEDVNVIQVNWVKGAAVAYDQAVSNTRVVGAQVAYMIKMLMEERNARAEDFHVVGFSLGAHVAGFAGKGVQAGGLARKLGRITGLDPANPGFNYDNATVRLDRSDAEFVDVIHTDTRTVLVMSSGMNRNLGHVDFYPNGGADQTGCNSWEDQETWMSAVKDSTVCDHLRAPQLFRASVNATDDNLPLTGYRCGSYEQFKRGVCLRCQGKLGRRPGSNRCAKMGYWATPPKGKKQIQYYLDTTAQSPFTVDHYQVQIHWRNETRSSPNGFKAKLFLTLHGDVGSSQEIALNDALTFHVLGGHTTRFLVTHDSKHPIGRVERVSFRWERPSCWAWFFCPEENIYLKRIKIFDAAEQKRTVFVPLERLQTRGVSTKELPPNTSIDLFRFARLPKTAPSGPLISPPLVPAHARPSDGVTTDQDGLLNR